MGEVFILLFIFIGLLLFFITPLAFFVDKEKYKENEDSSSHKKQSNHSDNQHSEKAEQNEKKNKDEKFYGNILGLKGKVKITDIHKAYRQKMKEYHPDKISSMAKELQQLALNRTKEINEAYEYFKKKYGK